MIAEAHGIATGRIFSSRSVRSWKESKHQKQTADNFTWTTIEESDDQELNEERLSFVDFAEASKVALDSWRGMVSSEELPGGGLHRQVWLKRAHGILSPCEGQHDRDVYSSKTDEPFVSIFSVGRHMILQQPVPYSPADHFLTSLLRTLYQEDLQQTIIFCQHERCYRSIYQMAHSYIDCFHVHPARHRLCTPL